MDEPLIQIGSSMKFDCESQHHKCKAECCGIIDFTKELWERNQHKVITKPVEVIPFPDNVNVMPITESGYCPFLRADYHCNIYEERPNVCREYGNESTPEMSCPYLKKDGIQRSRQNRRSLQRMMVNRFKSTGKKFQNLVRTNQKDVDSHGQD